MIQEPRAVIGCFIDVRKHCLKNLQGISQKYRCVPRTVRQVDQNRKSQTPSFFYFYDKSKHRLGELIDKPDRRPLNILTELALALSELSESLKRSVPVHVVIVDVQEVFRGHVKSLRVDCIQLVSFLHKNFRLFRLAQLLSECEGFVEVCGGIVGSGVKSGREAKH